MVWSSIAKIIFPTIPFWLPSIKISSCSNSSSRRTNLGDVSTTRCTNINGTSFSSNGIHHQPPNSSFPLLDLPHSERQIVPSPLSFSSLNSRSLVYIAGVPSIVATRERVIYPSFQGSVRKIRYGLCGDARQPQSPMFSTLPTIPSSKQSISFCAGSLLRCWNDDRTLSSQCDCFVKACQSTSKLIRKWFALWRRTLLSLARKQRSS